MNTNAIERLILPLCGLMASSFRVGTTANVTLARLAEEISSEEAVDILTEEELGELAKRAQARIASTRRKPVTISYEPSGDGGGVFRASLE